MPSQWQRSETLTQIQLCPPGDGQMDIANVSPVPGVSIIEPRKRGKQTWVTIMMQCQNAKCRIAACMCVFSPIAKREEVVISFHGHTALGALTASEGPSERPNVNLMTWRWANDKYARWRWQPFFYIWFCFPLTPSPLPRSCFQKSIYLLFQCVLLAVEFNNSEICMVSALCKKKHSPLR